MKPWLALLITFVGITSIYAQGEAIVERTMVERSLFNDWLTVTCEGRIPVGTFRGAPYTCGLSNSNVSRVEAEKGLLLPSNKLKQSFNYVRDGYLPFKISFKAPLGTLAIKSITQKNTVYNPGVCSTLAIKADAETYGVWKTVRDSLTRWRTQVCLRKVYGNGDKTMVEFSVSRKPGERRDAGREIFHRLVTFNVVADGKRISSRSVDYVYEKEDDSDGYRCIVCFPVRLDRAREFEVGVHHEPRSRQLESVIKNLVLPGYDGNAHKRQLSRAPRVWAKEQIQVIVTDCRRRVLRQKNGTSTIDVEIGMDVTVHPDSPYKLEELRLTPSFQAFTDGKRPLHFRQIGVNHDPYVISAVYSCNVSAAVRTIMDLKGGLQYLGAAAKSFAVSIGDCDIPDNGQRALGLDRLLQLYNGWAHNTNEFRTTFEQLKGIEGDDYWFWQSLVRLGTVWPVEVRKEAMMRALKLSPFRLSREIAVNGKNEMSRFDQLMHLSMIEDRQKLFWAQPRKNPTDEFNTERLLAGERRLPLTVDGSLEDWKGVPTTIVCQDIAREGDYFRVALALQYDRDFLYLSANWVDRTPMKNEVDPACHPLVGWLGDGLQIYYLREGRPRVLDCWYSRMHRQGVVYERPATPGRKLIDMTFGKVYFQSGVQVEEGLQQAFRENPIRLGRERGYCQELRIPWSLMGISPPEAGTHMPMGVRFSWGDYRTECRLFTPRADASLNSSKPWQTSGAWGTIEFTDEVEPEHTQHRRLAAAKAGVLKSALTLNNLEGSAMVGMTFLDNDQLLCCDKESRVRIINSRTGAIRRTFPAIVKAARSFACAPDVRLYAVGTKKGKIFLCSTAAGKNKGVLTHSGTMIRALAFSADGRLLGAGGLDGRITLWNPQTLKLIRELPIPRGASGIAISPDGDYLAAASLNRKLYIWKLSDMTGTPCHVLTGHTFMTRSLAFSSDSRNLISGADDMVVKIWTLSDGAARETLQTHSSLITSIAMSRKTNAFITSDMGGELVTWSQKETCTGTVKQLDGDGIVSLAVSPDETRLAVACRDLSLVFMEKPYVDGGDK